MDEMIAAMAITPANLSQRLKQAFHIEPAQGVQLLKSIIAETLALVETHFPGFDTAPYQANSARRRQAWDAPPFAL